VEAECQNHHHHQQHHHQERLCPESRTNGMSYPLSECMSLDQELALGHQWLDDRSQSGGMRPQECLGTAMAGSAV
jgi:hypothetical protein